MPLTARGFPYPAEGDTPDVPRDITALANRAEAEFVSMTGVAFSGAAPGTVGRRIRITATGGGYTAGQVFLDIGSAFVQDSADLSSTQPLDADLTAIAALPTGSGPRLPYATGPGAWSLSDLSEFMRGLLGDPDAATARAALSAQASDADLTALAALPSATDKLPYATGANAWALTTLSAFIRTLLDDPDAATARATLGAGPAITYSTSKPVAPADGDLWVYRVTTDCHWLFRWLAVDARWYCIGGIPALAKIDTAETIPDNSTWTDPATVGPSFTAPFAGDYISLAHAGLGPNSYGSNTYLGIGIGAAGPSFQNWQVAQAGGYQSVVVCRASAIFLTAGQTLRVRYNGGVQGGGGYTHTVRNRTLEVIPSFVQ